MIPLDRDTYRHYSGPITCLHCKNRLHIRLGGWDGLQLEAPPRMLGDPSLLAGLPTPLLPPDLWADFQEAARCQDWDALRAAAVMCRHIVHQALLIAGVPDQRLDEMVDLARKKELLSEMTARQSMAAAFIIGNAAHAHSDWAGRIGADDARHALQLTKKVLRELFRE